MTRTGLAVSWIKAFMKVCGRDRLFITPQTELQEGQGGQIFSAVEQEAVLFQTHVQNSVLWTDTEHLEAKDSALY